MGINKGTQTKPLTRQTENKENQFVDRQAERKQTDRQTKTYRQTKTETEK